MKTYSTLLLDVCAKLHRHLSRKSKVLLLACLSLAYMAVDAQPVAFLGTGNNIPMGNNRLVVVTVCHFGNISGVTWNGMAMTLGVSQQHSLAGAVDIWVLPVGSGAAFTGSGAVVTGAGSPSSTHVQSFENVDQANPVGDAMGAQSSSVTVNAVVGDMIWEAFMRRDQNAISGSSGQTEVFDVEFNISASRCWGGYLAAAAGSNTVTLSTSNGVHGAIVMQFVCNDAAPPMITCPADQVQNVDAACQAVLADYTGSATVSDDCDPSPTVTQSPVAGTVINTATMVTLTATDASGGSNTCSFMVNLADAIAPSITCPGNEGLAGCSTADITSVSSFPFSGTSTRVMIADFMTEGGTASDNCGIDSISYSDVAAGTCPTTVTRTYVVTDLAGLTASCVQTFTIVDDMTPDLTCPADLTVEGCDVSFVLAATGLAYSPGASPITQMQLTTAGGSVSDNCAVAMISYQDAIASPSCPLMIYRAFTAYDGCGNSTTCVQEITVEDTQAPIWQIAHNGMVVADNNVFTVPGTTYNLLTVECDSTTTFVASGFDFCDGAVVADGAVQITSLMTDPNRPTVVSPIVDAGGGMYTFDVTWGLNQTLLDLSMTDSCGNSQALTLAANGIDTEPPFWAIKDSMGMAIADNDPFTVPGSAVNLGNLPIDPNQCGHPMTLMAMGIDSCIGMIDQPGAVQIVGIVSGSPLTPTTAMVSDDGAGNYRLDLDWGVGSSTVTYSMSDLSGNTAQLSVSATVNDPYAGNTQPNANDLVPSLDVNGQVCFQVHELAGNVSCSDPVNILIETESGLQVFYAQGLLRSDFVKFIACAYRGRRLKATVIGAGGSAWGYLTIKGAGGPIIGPGRSKDVYCFDPLVFGGHIDDELPKAYVPCGGPVEVSGGVDWIEAYDCGPNFDPSNDTLKVIYREYAAVDKDGNRASVFDTLTVFRLPPIEVQGTSTSNAYCAERDTTYCGVTGSKGPFMIYPERCEPGLPVGMGNDPDMDGTFCDTLYFLVYDTTLQRFVENPFFAEAKCGISVHLDYWNFGSDGCSEVGKYTLEVKQSCLGPRADICVLPPTLAATQAFEQISPGYYLCEFWITDLDTVPPQLECKFDNPDHVRTDLDVDGDCFPDAVVIVSTSTHECAAHTYLPKVCVAEDWSGIKQVKATIAGIGTFALQRQADTCILADGTTKGYCFSYHGQVKIPKSELPTRILYEAYDSCHLIGTYICYIWPKDDTRPVAVSDKGVTVSLSDKKVWVEATTFDEGSWDNCGVNLLLARRSDWYDACIDLCDAIDNCYISEHHDTLWYATLEDDKHVDEVEAHYAKTLEWLSSDNVACHELLWNAWQYDLLRHATSECREHPYDVTREDINHLLLQGLKDAGATELWDKFYLEPPSLQIEREPNADGCFIDNLRLGGLDGDQFIGPRCNGDGTYRTCFYVSGTNLPGPNPNYRLYINGVEHQIAAVFTDGPYRVICATGLTTGLADIDVNIQLDVGCCLQVVDLYDAPSCTANLASGLPSDSWLMADQEDMPHLYFGGYSEADLKDRIDEWSQIGGGWSDAVPFSCEDACGPVTVEILVMDYWCNWSTAWTKVWVEDKTPVEVVKDVVEEEHITCKIYKDSRYAYPNEIHPVSLEYIVGQAKDGEQDAYDALDEIFGGYCKAWRDPYGNYVDSEGTEIDCDITFYDSVCKCTSYYDQVRVYDEHLGYLWVDSLVTKCDYYQDTLDFQKGVVVVNCEENVYCEQDVWCEIDHCGQGYIFRKFKIWQGCPDEFYDEHGIADSLRHAVDTIYRHQRIWVGNECELSKYMFDVPYDTEVVTCDIEYGPDGNVIGAAGPEYTGYATYKFDDDCRIVGIGHSDKVFKIVGGEAACYKIIRTWYFADWCGYGEPLDGQWWRNNELVTDTCVQKIIVRDTTPPTCQIIGPVEDGGAIEVGACYFDLEASVVGMDACGVIKYYWDLKEIKDGDDATIVDSDHGALSGDTTEGFDISSADLPHGSYKLVVTVQDDCANESYCEYYFDVVSVKKPSPVCISSLTARLTPWDSDQDGVVDSAHAIVWAEEFNSSSSEACTDTALEYRVELIDGIDDDTWQEDTSYLEVFCDDFGSHMARLWVISWPSGTVDFCDVVLIVQSDFSGCATTVSGEPGPVSQVNDMHDVVGQPQRQSIGQPTQPGIGGRPLGQGFAPSGYLLEQNRPNPFKAETVIGFVLPEAMEATLTVYDVTGRVLRSIKGDYAKGYQTVQLHKTNLAGHAILYYRLDAKDFTATKKMILVN